MKSSDSVACMVTATSESDAPVMRVRADVWRQRMLALGYPTVAAQAAALGVTRQGLSKILNGHRGPAPSTARRMAEVAQLPPSRLFELAAA